MTAPAPEPIPEEDEPPAGEQAQAGGLGEVRFTWVPGSGENGVEVLGAVPPGQVPDGPVVTGGPAGLDWQALLDALAASGRLGRGEDQAALHAEDLAARDQGRLGPPLAAEEVAAVAVEHMVPGAAMAGWLSVAAGGAGWLDEDALTGLAVGACAPGCRRC